MNPDKFNIHIRNQVRPWRPHSVPSSASPLSSCSLLKIFVASATQRYNESAGRVLAGALIACLPTERIPFGYRSESLAYNTISRAIPPVPIPASQQFADADPTTISLPAPSNKLVGLSVPKKLLATVDKDDETALKIFYVKEYVNVLCVADNPSEAGRMSAFLSLTMGAGGGGGKRVTVEYEIIARRLRAMVLDNTVRDKWGTAGIRIIQILRDCGKLDSEQVRWFYLSL